MITKNCHRSHTCGALRLSDAGEDVWLMGWVHVKRNLGGLLFIDLRDHYGITQVVIHPEAKFFDEANSLRAESVIQVKGKVVKRESVNSKIPTGDIEIVVSEFRLESASDILPFPVAHNPKQESEDTRLKFRFLDLRTERLHKNIVFHNDVIRSLREGMYGNGFMEFQTPILTSSSPEGARDFLVPSRLHPGKFYALPQAPQQFKQILMCSGFDRYFQIAPCFRDEDPRADRAPGEFYQLDLEMAYATQDDVFANAEKLMKEVFVKHGAHRRFPATPFRRIPWLEAMDKYGSDKPDLRFACEMHNVESVFANTTFGVFKNVLEQNGILRAIRAPGAAAQSRKFFDEADAFVKEQGLGGMPWLAFNNGEWKGSLAKVLSDTEKEQLTQALSLQNGDAVVFVVGKDKLKTQSVGGRLRLWLADKLSLRDLSAWSFLWIVDFPMFEMNEEDNKVDFSHNPFSMPQGGMEALQNKNPLDVLAYQYDLVCNGYEVASGATRNHRRDIMQKAFELAGYPATEVESRFGALWNAFQYGAPPHSGMAFGIARLVMILLDEPNIREVIAFPLNGRAMDLMMGAPSEVSEKQIRDVHVAIVKPAK
jgi:aspartyl-tRNA synthetase